MSKIKTLTVTFGFFAVMLIVALSSMLRVEALTSSSLQLSDPRPSETGVTYTFNSSVFDTTTTISCIDLSLNTLADGSGSAVGTTTGFTLTSSSLITAGSWTTDGSTNGRLRLTNGSGETPATSGNIVYSGITNSGSEGTFYGIFTTYDNVGCTTPTGGVDSVTVAFVVVDGELVQLTIDPTLTFSVNAVASGQAVNGATTSVASTASGINFLNGVTLATNGVSAHDLEVVTNATGGYSVYIRHTGLLSNGSDNIANHTGTNASPSAFPAAGTEAWGYTTLDSNLSGDTADRFTNPANRWSSFNTTNEVVADNTTALSGTETTRVGHQVGISATTPAGTYQTTIIYTVASVY